MVSIRAACASRPRDNCRSSDARRRGRSERGFSLVEVLVAMGLFTVGMLALAQLLAAGVQMHQLGRNTDAATQLAQAKFEELMKLNFNTAAAVQLTPSGVDALGANTANYFDVPAGNQFTRRWRVEAGPTPRTRRVTVRIEPIQASRRTHRPIEITTLIREW
jgi:prepilin-type N-terminal cleavage/methylation domain-containing protein